VPTFVVFLLGPLFDVWFSRRTYAIASTLVAAAGSLGTLLAGSNHVLLGASMFCALLGSSATFMAIVVRFGPMIGEESHAALGAWLNVTNVGGVGAFAAVGMLVIRAMPLPIAAGVLTAPVLLPLLIYARISAPPPDSRLAGESFAAFFRDVGALLRR